MKKILVTGANGYIGRHLVKRLLKEDCQLVALVRDLGKMPAWLLGNEKLQVIEGDLQNQKTLEKALEGVDVVFHLAAALRMFEKNGELYQTNIGGLKNLLSACKAANRPMRFIFASSIDVEKRQSDYSQAKLQGEEIIKEFCRKNPKISYIIARIGNVWGGQKGGMVGGIKELINQNNWRSSILYHALGNKHLYLIEIKSLVNKLVGFVESEIHKNRTHLLVDEEITVKNLVDRLAKQKLIKPSPKKLPFSVLILKVWQTLSRVLKRGDLLVYLSLGK